MSDKCQHEHRTFVRSISAESPPPGEYRFWLEQCQEPSCKQLVLCRKMVVETEPAVRLAP